MGDAQWQFAQFFEFVTSARALNSWNWLAFVVATACMRRGELLLLSSTATKCPVSTGAGWTLRLLFIIMNFNSLWRILYLCIYCALLVFRSARLHSTLHCVDCDQREKREHAEVTWTDQKKFCVSFVFVVAHLSATRGIVIKIDERPPHTLLTALRTLFACWSVICSVSLPFSGRR